MKEVIEVLEEVKPGEDYKNNKTLVSDGVLTSFDIVMLVSLLNEKFGVNISVMDLVPENFESVESIHSMIEKLKNN